MPKRIRVICPKEVNKKYFSFEKQKYKNDLSIYVNDAIVFSHINDAEECLPITLEEPISLDENKEHTIKCVYDVLFDTVNEKVDIIFKLKTNGVLETSIHRHNFVEGSETLDSDFLITFVINDQKTLLGKEYHEGNTANITFDNYYTYPLKIKWGSKKSFTDTENVYWDDIELRLE
mgnify:CR=1 FL=1|jgi:hypothetical protein|tara:strand:+ start:109 stop:636 length:528 start_codon:yes stop_codon:yes gene_type:complete